MTTPDPDEINDLADEMPRVAAVLAEDERNLLRGLFRAGAVAQLEAAGFHTDETVAKVVPGSWRIGLVPDPGDGGGAGQGGPGGGAGDGGAGGADPGSGGAGGGDPGSGDPGTGDPGGGGSAPAPTGPGPAADPPL